MEEEYPTMDAIIGDAYRNRPWWSTEAMRPSEGEDRRRLKIRSLTLEEPGEGATQ